MPNPTGDGIVEETETVLVTEDSMQTAISLMKYWNAVKECFKAKQPVSTTFDLFNVQLDYVTLI